MSVLDGVLNAAVERQASDVYVQSDSPVYLRVEGSLVRTDLRLSRGDVEFLVDDVLQVQGAMTRLYELEEIDRSYVHRGPRGVTRWRVNVSLCLDGITVVFRRLREVLPDPSFYGVPERFLEVVSSAPYGLVVVAGPTGSGKSTTLAATIGWLSHRRPVSIVTIEDPIEYLIPCGPESRCAMREVGRHTKSFERALRAAMRQRPDVILVGEVRDPETALAAVQAAKTGHLVFTTLHTGAASLVPFRIASMFPPERQQWILSELADCLVCAAVQVLVPGRDGTRVPAFELFDTRPAAVREAIASLPHPEVRRLLPAHGWTLEQDLERLVSAGRIAPEAAGALKGVCDGNTVFCQTHPFSPPSRSGWGEGGDN